MMYHQDFITEYTREEIKKIVKMIRLELYNQGQCCCAKAIKKSIGPLITPNYIIISGWSKFGYHRWSILGFIFFIGWVNFGL